MPRLPRLDDPGSRHHVMNRGARKESVFVDAASCERFIGLLAELPGRFGVIVHGYAVMPNHFHVLLTVGHHGLGPSMKHLQGEYSRWLNAKKSWDGPVWRARYRSRPVDSEDYWRHLLAYVHLNPVKASLVPTVGDAMWTSHAAYAGVAPEWLDTAEHLSLFGGARAYLEYLADLRMGRDVAPEGFDADALFRRDARVLPVAVERRVAVARPHDWPMSPDAAWSALEMVTGSGRAELTARRRGPGANRLWWLTAWWLPVATGQQSSWWARNLGVQRSTLSRAKQQLEREVRHDVRLAGWQRRLQELAGLGRG